jgi:hypothetical protein
VVWSRRVSSSTTLVGAGLVVFFKQRAKALPESLLSTPTVSTLFLVGAIVMTLLEFPRRPSE